MTIIINTIQEIIRQLMILVPMLLVSLVIWWIGNYLLDLGARLLKKVDLPFTKLDEKAVNNIIKFGRPIGKVILVLVILDYLGIGRTLISSLATGLTLTIAIALGLAFGKALEPEAENAVRLAKKHFHK